jgi:hypothetical protein
MVEVNNNSFTSSADNKQLTMDNDDGSQIDAVAAVAAASGRRTSDGGQLSVLATSSGKRRFGAASSSREMRDGGQKKSHAFSMPFKTPRKKSSHTDDSNDDGFSFGSMMCMMMHQSWMESEQRERQNEQRERQHRIDAKLREPEYELCREEMVIACEEACAQRQLMNVMMMSLLNKNGGDNVLAPQEALWMTSAK